VYWEASVRTFQIVPGVARMDVVVWNVFIGGW
jgi:hypothetical protein